MFVLFFFFFFFRIKSVHTAGASTWPVYICMLDKCMANAFLKQALSPALRSELICVCVSNVLVVVLLFHVLFVNIHLVYLHIKHFNCWDFRCEFVLHLERRPQIPEIALYRLDGILQYEPPYFMCNKRILLAVLENVYKM